MTDGAAIPDRPPPPVAPVPVPPAAAPCPPASAPAASGPVAPGPAAPGVAAPGLGALAACFARVALLSVGGGLTAWIRRAVVEREGWMGEREFLSGFALSQVAPGPNAVNLAVFVGSTLRGAPGAVASLLGLMLPPLALVLILGWLYAARPVPPPVSHALDGMGAAAVGLLIATGLRMARSALRGALPIVLAVLVAAALAFGLRLLPVIAVSLPLALLMGRFIATPAPPSSRP
ncbi:MAG: chromate transporter [Gluconacetobacter diazotrophicus]|nr:chromate transporter [Gluconacetobacter diazotrophicus]